MLVFTDGGCINNGKKNAKAAYALYINDYIIRGHVMPYEYEYNLDILSNNGKFICPSNNRAELLALIRAFMEILNFDDTNFTVYSDSQICVKTINEWYPNRLKKGTIHEFKNLDLINIMMTLYNKIKLTKNIEIIHVRGHQTISKNSTEYEKKIIGGNELVDKYATSILHLNTFIDYEIIKNIYSSDSASVTN